MHFYNVFKTNSKTRAKPNGYTKSFQKVMSYNEHVLSTKTYVPSLGFVFPNKFCHFLDNKLRNILENVVFLEQICLIFPFCLRTLPNFWCNKIEKKKHMTLVMWRGMTKEGGYSQEQGTWTRWEVRYHNFETFGFRNYFVVDMLATDYCLA
jgi:hypothetical protein